MLQKFQEHIATNFPFLKGKRLLIAISGGVDSVVLTHLIVKLSGVKISLAHCNFQLRGKESDLDEEFIRNLSQQINCKIYVKRFNTTEFSKENKLSAQVAARDLRYNWFQELIEKHNFDYVLTAHHADDNLETFLINLTRGSGLDGFTGIPKINRNIARPLLVFSREEILTYAKENDINWREDKSNASTKYVRNKIRHQVIPVLKEINPSLLETFSKTSEHLQESKQIIDDKIDDVSAETVSVLNDGIIKIDINKIQLVSNPKAYLYQLLKEYNFTEWNDVFSLLTAQSGKQILSETHRLIKDRAFLLVSKNVTSSLSTSLKINSIEKFLIQENQTEITKPIHLIIEKTSQISTENKQTIYLDKDLLKFPLVIKKWAKGDYICPIGMKGTKKISKFFKDAKYSLLEKENAWLLFNADNDVIWIINDRQDRRFITADKTKNILKITTL